MKQKQKKSKRENNIVIHGVVENSSNNKNKNKEADEEFVSSLIGILGSNVTPQSIIRLGKVDGNKRPLRLCMKSNKDKEQKC